MAVADDARQRKGRKFLNALRGVRREIRLQHRLTRKAMRIGHMEAVAVGLDTIRDSIEKFTAAIDVVIRRGERKLKKPGASKKKAAKKR